MTKKGKALWALHFYLGGGVILQQCKELPAAGFTHQSTVLVTDSYVR